MKRPFAITGIVVFSCAAMLGSLLTALVPFQLETWWFWPVVRVAWQLGGGLWCGLGIAMLVDGGYFKLTAGVGALGLLLAINPVLDLVRGPAQGMLLSVGTTRYPAWAALGPGARVSQGSQSIQGTLVLQNQDGQEVVIEPIGAQANRMESLTVGCGPGHGGQATALRGLDVVLEIDCSIVGGMW